MIDFTLWQDMLSVSPGDLLRTVVEKTSASSNRLTSTCGRTGTSRISPGDLLHTVAEVINSTGLEMYETLDDTDND